MIAMMAVLLAAQADPAAARTQGSLALYTPKPEHEPEFAQGYARHLRWHLDNADPWAWYVWSIATGERRGQYVGGSFGHPWADLDRRPKAHEDAVDHERNIDRHLERSGSRMLESRADLGGQLPLLESTPAVAAFEYAVRPAARGAFEDGLRRLEALRTEGAGDAYGWFEVVNGDALPAYVLLVPLAGRADLERVRYERLGARAQESARAQEALAQALAAVASVRSELWTFRSDLSTCVLSESACVGAVPAAK